jgi:hypothetical protein
MAIRMLSERGAITPELTEAMLGAIAPDVMNAIRTSQQAASVAPLPPEVEQALQQASAGAEAAGNVAESPEATPAPEGTENV